MTMQECPHEFSEHQMLFFLVAGRIKLKKQRLAEVRLNLVSNFRDPDTIFLKQNKAGPSGQEDSLDIQC